MSKQKVNNEKELSSDEIKEEQSTVDYLPVDNARDESNMGPRGFYPLNISTRRIFDLHSNPEKIREIAFGTPSQGICGSFTEIEEVRRKKMASNTQNVQK